jgi:hypothetical protein
MMKTIKNNIREGAVRMDTPRGPEIIKSPNGYMRNSPNQIDYFNQSTKRKVPSRNPFGPQTYYGQNAERNFKTEFIPLYQKIVDAIDTLSPIVTVNYGELCAKLVDNLPSGGTFEKQEIFKNLDVAKSHVDFAVRRLVKAKEKFKKALVVLGVENNPTRPENNHFEYYHIKEDVENMVHNSLMKLLKEQKDKGDI